MILDEGQEQNVIGSMNQSNVSVLNMFMKECESEEQSIIIDQHKIQPNERKRPFEIVERKDSRDERKPPSVFS